MSDEDEATKNKAQKKSLKRREQWKTDETVTLQEKN